MSGGSSYFAMTCSVFIFLLTRPAPRSTLFPYTTLFRSLCRVFSRSQNARLRRLQVQHPPLEFCHGSGTPDRKSTRMNSSHLAISYAVFCLKKKKQGRDKLSRQSS